MDVELKNKWIDALRSGKYLQGSDQLVCSRYLDEPETFCCLGVLADIMEGVKREGDQFLFPLDGIDMNPYLDSDEPDATLDDWQGDNDEFIVDGKIVAETMIPTPIAAPLGLRIEVEGEDWQGKPKKMELRNRLAHLNDTSSATFDEIADLLESLDF